MDRLATLRAATSSAWACFWSPYQVRVERCQRISTPSTGLWSLIKRAPKAKIRRKTFEVAGPAQADAMPLDARARAIFSYFKKYNYTVKSTGDVICFEGTYAASASQAAALTLYTLVSTCIGFNTVPIAPSTQAWRALPWC